MINVKLNISKHVFVNKKSLNFRLLGYHIKEIENNAGSNNGRMGLFEYLTKRFDSPDVCCAI